MDLTNQANQPGHPRGIYAHLQSEPSSAGGNGMESLEMPSSSAARVANAPNLEVVVNVNDDDDGDDQLEDEEEEEQQNIGQPQASGQAEQEEDIVEAVPLEERYGRVQGQTPNHRPWFNVLQQFLHVHGQLNAEQALRSTDTPYPRAVEDRRAMVQNGEPFLQPPPPPLFPVGVNNQLANGWPQPPPTPQHRATIPAGANNQLTNGWPQPPTTPQHRAIIAAGVNNQLTNGWPQPPATPQHRPTIPAGTNNQLTNGWPEPPSTPQHRAIVPVGVNNQLTNGWPQPPPTPQHRATIPVGINNQLTNGWPQPPPTPQHRPTIPAGTNNQLVNGRPQPPPTPHPRAVAVAGGGELQDEIDRLPARFFKVTIWSPITNLWMNNARMVVCELVDDRLPLRHVLCVRIVNNRPFGTPQVVTNFTSKRNDRFVKKVHLSLLSKLASLAPGRTCTLTTLMRAWRDSAWQVYADYLVTRQVHHGRRLIATTSATTTNHG